MAQRKPGAEDPSDVLASAESVGAHEAPTRAAATAAFEQSKATLPKKIGRYRIEKQIGQGGMGAVYLAHDEQLDRKVALKVPRFAAADSESKERFHREARAAAAVEHPNICPIYDVGEADGITYMTMAYVEGRPLSKYIQPGKALRQKHVAAVVRKIALALAAAHAQKVVHRDLKPANVMLAPGKGPVVMDFGLALRGASQDHRLTRTGIVMGTPAYMSPEQVSGDPDAVGPASDIYSLGVILYELLAGRPPFIGGLAEILGRIALDSPSPPSEFRPGLDGELEAICLKMMARDPADRFASMSDAAAALDRYVKTEKKPPPLPQRAVETGAHPAEALFAAMAETPAPPVALSPISQSFDTQPFATLPTKPTAADRRINPLWAAVAAGGALILLALLGVVLLVRTPKGLVQIELSDPAAQVEVKVDGEKVRLSGIGDPLELTVGTHHLLVTGKDFHTVSESFTVRRDGNPVLRITLKPEPSSTEKDADASADTSPAETMAQNPIRPATASSPVEQSARRFPGPRSSGTSSPGAGPTAQQMPSAQAGSGSRGDDGGSFFSRGPDGWININPMRSPSWSWDARNKNRVYKTMNDDVLTLDNGAVDFPNFKGNLVIRAQIKHLGGTGNVGISAGGQYALASNVKGRVYFGLGYVDKNGAFKDTAKSTLDGHDANNYYDLEVTAAGERIIVKVNGQQVMSAKRIEHDATPGINAWHAKAMFRNIQIRRP